MIDCHSDRKVVLTLLVHGTWGRGLFPPKVSDEECNGYLWFQTQSEFSQDLIRILSVSFHNTEFKIKPFLWSGKNSIKERFIASDNLHLWLDNKLLSEQFSDIVIISHSHGGNIVKRAAMKLNHPNIHLISMATPFLEISVGDTANARVGAYMASLFLLPWAIYMSILSIGYVIPYFSFLDWENFTPLVRLAAPYVIQFLDGVLWILNNDWIGKPVAIVLLLLAVLPFVFIGQVLGIYDPDKLTRLAESTKGDLSWAELYNTGVLILRSADDEAGLVLAAGELGNLISNVLMSTTSFLLMKIYAFGSIAFIFFLIVLYPIDISRYFLPFDASWSLNKSSIIVLLAFAYGTAFVLSGIFKSTHGRELLIGTIGGVLNAQSVPDLNQSATVITLPIQSTKRIGFKHSIYGHRDCVPTIVDWLAHRISDSGHSSLS